MFRTFVQNIERQAQSGREHCRNRAVLDGEVQFAVVEHDMSRVDGAAGRIGRPNGIWNNNAILLESGGDIDGETREVSVGRKEAANFVADLQTLARGAKQNLAAAKASGGENHLRRADAVLG